METIPGLGIELPVQSEFEFIVDARLLPITLVETGPQYIARLEREEARIARFQAKFRRVEKKIAEHA